MTAASVAIVTGASSGIGQATAIRLARDFGVVVLAARDQPGLDETAASIRTCGKEAMVYAADLRTPDAATMIVDDTLKRYGRIDALVNIAGAVAGTDLFHMTDAQWDDGMALKFHGARRLTIKAWDALKASRGSVVFMSGNAALHPTPGAAAIAAINAAITALARAFAKQGIGDGVQVNSVSPGAVLTDRRRALLKTDDAIAAFPAHIGIARFGMPDEIAELMAYLVSPAAKWMTGTDVRIDGGEG
jgi:3-oxoacyl-[acyl-carrier protein] reductase